MNGRTMENIALVQQDFICELIRSSLKITVTLAVPPRCSGPYEGIQLTSLPSIKPE